jgi:tripartite-type tricarboxylate transporter receptor subunit TctC
MTLPRRAFLRLVAGATVLPGTVRMTRAQTYPSRPIRVIVPYIPGSPVDAAARVVVQQLQSRLRQSIIIENRPGAGTTIGTKAVAGAAPDGYTLLFNGDSMGYYPVLYPDLNFDPLKNLTPIATAMAWSHVMVISPIVPANTVGELVAYAKANPGKLVFGFGLGTAPHILGEVFKTASGVELNFIPYRGGEQARSDLLGGRVHINFAPLSNILPLIEDRKARPLAFTGPRRTPHLPAVPTMAESGYPQVGFDPDSWLSFLGPVGMPMTIVEQFNAEINQSLRSPELSAALDKLGIEPKTGTPKEFAAFLASEMQKWPPLLRAAGLQPA